MSVRQQARTAYGLSDALLNVPLFPIVSDRSPGVNDKADIGTIWINKDQNIAYILTSVVNNEATWVISTQAASDFEIFDVQTADATPTAIATFPMGASSSLSMEVQINATKDDFTQAYGNSMFAIFRRGAAGAPVRVGGAIAEDPLADIGVVSFSDLVVVGNSAVILVVGTAAETWNWTAVVNAIARE